VVAADIGRQEIEPVVDPGDAGLVLVEGQTALLQPNREPVTDLFGLFPAVTERDEIVRLWGPVGYADRGVMVLAGGVAGLVWSA
jgi:hypothetical protein